jgi:hypothetical protein
MLDPCPSAAFRDPGDLSQFPVGIGVIDANGLPLAHVYVEPPDANPFTTSPSRIRFRNGGDPNGASGKQ